jgi:hypothetical protein
MTFRNQFVLALILFSLGGFTYWNEYKRRPEAEKKALAEKKILPLTGMLVATLEVERDGKVYRFQCEDIEKGLCKFSDPSHWRMESPLKTKADDSNVNSLLTSLSNWAPTETIDLSEDSPEKRAQYLKDYGLAGSTFSSRVKVTGKDGKSYELLFGQKHPVSDATFIGVRENEKLNDQKVHLLATYHWNATDHDLTFWRDKKILSLNQTEVIAAELNSATNRNEIIRLEKSPLGWQVNSKNRKLTGDQDAIGALVSGALFLNAKGYAAESKNSPEGKKLLSGSKKVIELTLKTATDSQTLEVFEKTFVDGKKKASAAYAVVPNLDPLYELETTTLDQLTKTFDELRVSKLVPGMDRFSLNFVSAESGEGEKKTSVTLSQENSAWSENEKEIDGTAVNALLDLVSAKSLGPKTWDREKAKEAKSTLSLQLGLKSTDIRFHFLFWKTSEGTFVLDQRNTEMPVFEVLPSVSGRLPWDVKSLVSTPKAEPIPLDSVKKEGH